jgi:hypothetical protein
MKTNERIARFLRALAEQIESVNINDVEYRETTSQLRTAAEPAFNADRSPKGWRGGSLYGHHYEISLKILGTEPVTVPDPS